MNDTTPVLLIICAVLWLYIFILAERIGDLEAKLLDKNKLSQPPEDVSLPNGVDPACALDLNEKLK